jgi:hypothetical protein
LFEKELRRVLRDPFNPDIRVSEWEDVIADLWIKSGHAVYQPTYDAYTGDSARSEVRQKGELVAIVESIIGDASSAEAINGYVRDAANGVVKTTRKRIDTVLRGLDQKELRRVTRAVRRLYKTQFITGRRKTKGHIRGGSQRDARIALDQVLKSTAEYEHAAAGQAEEKTGRRYMQFWRTQGDDRVRSTHSGVAPVPLDELFAVGGGMRFPRDPAGPASEVYGCRCWTERKRITTPKPVAELEPDAEEIQARLRALEKRADAVINDGTRRRSDWSGFDPDLAEVYTQRLEQLATKYPDIASDMKYLGTGGDVASVEDVIGGWGPEMGRTHLADAAWFRGRVRFNVDHAGFRSIDTARELVEKNAASGWWSTSAIDRTMTHEFGHLVDGAVEFNAKHRGLPSAANPRTVVQRIVNSERVSQYAATNEQELFAEMFAATEHGAVVDSSLAVEFAEFSDKLEAFKSWTPSKFPDRSWPPQ